MTDSSRQREAREKSFEGAAGTGTVHVRASAASLSSEASHSLATALGSTPLLHKTAPPTYPDAKRQQERRRLGSPIFGCSFGRMPSGEHVDIDHNCRARGDHISSHHTSSRHGDEFKLIECDRNGSMSGDEGGVPSELPRPVHVAKSELSAEWAEDAIGPTSDEISAMRVTHGYHDPLLSGLVSPSPDNPSPLVARYLHGSMQASAAPVVADFGQALEEASRSDKVYTTHERAGQSSLRIARRDAERIPRVNERYDRPLAPRRGWEGVSAAARVIAGQPPYTPEVPPRWSYETNQGAAGVCTLFEGKPWIPSLRVGMPDRRRRPTSAPTLRPGDHLDPSTLPPQRSTRPYETLVRGRVPTNSLPAGLVIDPDKQGKQKRQWATPIDSERRAVLPGGGGGVGRTLTGNAVSARKVQDEATAGAAGLVVGTQVHGRGRRSAADDGAMVRSGCSAIHETLFGGITDEQGQSKAPRSGIVDLMPFAKDWQHAIPSTKRRTIGDPSEAAGYGPTTASVIFDGLYGDPEVPRGLSRSASFESRVLARQRADERARIFAGRHGITTQQIAQRAQRSSADDLGPSNGCEDAHGYTLGDRTLHNQTAQDHSKWAASQMAGSQKSLPAGEASQILREPNTPRRPRSISAPPMRRVAIAQQSDAFAVIFQRPEPSKLAHPDSPESDGTPISSLPSGYTHASGKTSADLARLVHERKGKTPSPFGPSPRSMLEREQRLAAVAKREARNTLAVDTAVAPPAAEPLAVGGQTYQRTTNPSSVALDAMAGSSSTTIEVEDRRGATAISGTFEGTRGREELQVDGTASTTNVEPLRCTNSAEAVKSVSITLQATPPTPLVLADPEGPAVGSSSRRTSTAENEMVPAGRTTLEITHARQKGQSRRRTPTQLAVNSASSPTAATLIAPSAKEQLTTPSGEGPSNRSTPSLQPAHHENARSPSPRGSRFGLHFAPSSPRPGYMPRHHAHKPMHGSIAAGTWHMSRGTSHVASTSSAPLVCRAAP